MDYLKLFKMIGSLGNEQGSSKKKISLYRVDISDESKWANDEHFIWTFLHDINIDTDISMNILFD